MIDFLQTISNLSFISESFFFQNVKNILFIVLFLQQKCPRVQKVGVQAFSGSSSDFQEVLVQTLIA